MFTHFSDIKKVYKCIDKLENIVAKPLQSYNTKPYNTVFSCDTINRIVTHWI